jgi:hypothetical protein
LVVQLFLKLFPFVAAKPEIDHHHSKWNWQE